VLLSDTETEDRVIAFVAGTAKAKLGATRVVLFGSRAKRTHSERSDYDFAIESDPLQHANWSSFCADVHENAPTLNSIDLVDLSSPLSTSFREEIFATGLEVTADGTWQTREGMNDAERKD
jgi:predicted nucleotidyltransferase